MSKKEKGRQWDGKSRPTTDKYKQGWNDIFGKEKSFHEVAMKGFKKEQEELEEDDQDYLNSLKNKL